MMKTVNFTKRLEAATKGFESCEFWFEMLFFFNLKAVLYVMAGRKNRQNTVALHICLEYNTSNQ